MKGKTGQMAPKKMQVGGPTQNRHLAAYKERAAAKLANRASARQDRVAARDAEKARRIADRDALLADRNAIRDRKAARRNSVMQQREMNKNVRAQRNVLKQKSGNQSSAAQPIRGGG